MRAAAVVVVAAVLAGCGGGDAAPPRVLEVRVGAGHDATAFAIPGGRAITVAHVLGDAQPILVADRRASVVRVDRRLDIAVLAVRGESGGGATGGGKSGVDPTGGGDSSGGGARAIAAAEASPRDGARVFVRVLRGGAARSLPATVRRTIVARVGPAGGLAQVRPALELAAAVMPGDSGAPVVDRDGRLIGVIFAQASDRDDLAYALDARALGSLLTPAGAEGRGASPPR